MKHLCILLIKFYRRFISPHKGGSCCRFVPSCSAYAMEAFQKRGFFVGLILTVWRILRCNPLCAGGYDPVPERGLRYKGSREIPIDDETVDLCDCHSQTDPCREDDGKGGEQAAHRNEEASYTKDSEEN